MKLKFVALNLLLIQYTIDLLKTDTWLLQLLRHFLCGYSLHQFMQLKNIPTQ
jgi:uncharacterized membrane protein YczE